MEITQLNNELLKIREALAERDRLTRELGRAQTRLESERAELADRASLFGKENEHVRRLEGTSLVSLYYSLLGSRETRLSEERQELLGAKLKYDNARYRVAALEHDVAELSRQLSATQDLPGRYESLLAEKERLIQAGAGAAAAADELSRLSEALTAARAEERELREAIQAGKLAHAGLARAEESLQSASSWGAFDIFGGGMLASAVKHSRIDEAQAAIQEVQPLLQRFERELADVDGSININIQPGGLTAFVDIFTDSLLVDLLVQSRIGDSLDAVHSMSQRILDLMARLEKQHEVVLRRVQSAETERRTALENAR